MAEKGRLLRLVSGPANGQFRRSAEPSDLSEGLPLTDLKRSFGLRPSDGKVCPNADLRASAVARFSSAFRVAPPKLGGLSLMTAYAACRCSRSPSRNFSGMPIKRRSWSRPRDRRERTVPTGTLRIAATSS